LATFKNDIILIAGSGDFAFEAANYINTKKRLRHIILISKNQKISKNYKDKVTNFDLRNIEKLIKFIKQKLVFKVIIIGYAKLPSMSEINLSFSSKIILSKDFFLNNINSQSKILKKFIESKSIKILSQKKIFYDLLVYSSDQNIKKKHKPIHNYVIKNTPLIKKVFSLNLTQSMIMDGDRIISIEDIFGTDYMINKFKKINNKFKNLIFIKSIKKDQIHEIDFPIIGNQTLELLLKFNFKAICLINKSIIISNKMSFIENIKKSKLSLIVI